MPAQLRRQRRQPQQQLQPPLHLQQRRHLRLQLRLRPRHTYRDSHGYSYSDSYGYTYSHGNAKLHTALHIHRGDRNDRSGHNRYRQSHRRWHNGHHAAVPVQLYGQSFTAANISSNGNLQFVSNSNSLTNACPLPSATFNMPIMPHWDDLRTDQVGTGCTAYGGVGCGVFTSISGTAPNRIFNIEWRTVYFGANTTRANFELRLYEGQNRFDLVYGEVAQTGSSATVGVQQGTGAQFTQYECNTAGTVTSGLQLVSTEPPCGTPTPTPTPTATPSCTPGWSAGAHLPSVGVRSVGVYFPANGRFYAMGGRSADTAGSDFTHPFEYNPATNTWTTKAATYADNQVNNMACGVLTDAGTPYIYCVGGSAAGSAAATDRVFRYNPVTDVISPVASPWPGAMGTIVPGGFSVFNNKLYILGGFNNPVGMVDTIYEFTPNPAAWVLKTAHLPVRARLYTHHHHRQLHLHRGWQHVRSHPDPRRFD